MTEKKVLIVPKRCPALIGGGECTCPPHEASRGYICQATFTNIPRQTGKQLTADRIKQLLEGGLPFDDRMIQQIEREMMAARAQQEEESYGYPQRNVYRAPPNYAGPLAGKLRRDAEEGRTNFLSPELEHQIMEWTRTDQRVDQFWHQLTQRVRAGLTDTIVQGVMMALSNLLKQWNEQVLTLQEQEKTKFVTLLHTATDVVKGFDEAEARSDLVYMRNLVEELDAALLEIEERDDG